MKFQVNILSSPGITRGTDRPTDRQTDRPTDIVEYRRSVDLKNIDPRILREEHIISTTLLFLN